MVATYEEIEIAFNDGELDTTFPPSVYEAYCQYMDFDVESLTADYREASRNIGDNYIGHFDSHQEFICDGLEVDAYDKFPYLVIDYDESWERNYRHEFFEFDGHYFHQF